MSPPAAIVLAAGEGRRMGGPKALLMVDGEPLVVHHARLLREAGCGSIVVVARPSVSSAVQAALASVRGARVIAAETTGPAASLSMALRSIPRGTVPSILVTPVDLLPPRLSTLEALLSAVARDGVLAATPRYQGRGGHPVALRDALSRAFLEGYRGTLRELLASLGARRVRLEVDDPAVVGNLNAPADLTAACEGLRRTAGGG